MQKKFVLSIRELAVILFWLTRNQYEAQLRQKYDEILLLGVIHQNEGCEMADLLRFYLGEGKTEALKYVAENMGAVSKLSLAREMTIQEQQQIFGEVLCDGVRHEVISYRTQLLMASGILIEPLSGVLGCKKRRKDGVKVIGSSTLLSRLEQLSATL